ncbi:pyrroline-5-carboxylate reductase [Paenibacillus sp. NEAU-GSW1]|uniref:pyrroline-5-carboxylate reductase n=1 Tax=Paenibacillus sp. NEAU-GSW1 TaxID=2682486 RepID=UPI0012E23DE6|nr:pyrroline-5-carboxylate reductase [Paenibacillus sp. NEAU-GSW1]MUT65430.1 pyrroline-5-carboxylate reductase [Paenibacillus sp. NEAU-GSW1]
MVSLTKDTAAAIQSLQLCFYGAGSMAEAIMRGILNEKLTLPTQISMLNRSNNDRLTELNERYGIQTTLSGSTNEQFLKDADIIFLAMKPKDAAAAIASIAPFVNNNQLIVSVIAGISIATIEKLLGNQVPIVRTMPNTSSTIGLGATGISFSHSVTQEQKQLAEAIFQSVGITAAVDESLQNAIVGISGSGPAYVYYFMEAMMAAADKLGLEPSAAKELVVQTVLGAVEMVRQTGEEPVDLRRKVTSPNGTTQAAIETMAAGQLTETIVKGMLRSAERSGELGAEIERSIL